MDIFGVGILEFVIIGLVLVIVAGPQRSAIWAREIGQYIAKFRQYVSAMMAEFESEVGPDGKELLDAAREFSQQTSELRNVASGRGVLERFNEIVVSGLPSANPDNTPPQSKSGIKPQIANAPYEGWAKPAKTSHPAESEASEAETTNESDTET